MRIILNDDVYNLGEEGDICEVKPGYGRNYLIPQGLAVPFTKGNSAKFERRREAIDKRKEEKRTAAMGDKERLEKLELVIPMPAGDTGKLFGSVSNATVTDALAKEGVHIERKKVDLPEHHTIKMVGKYKARVRLYENNVAELTFLVVDEKTGSAEPKAAAKPVEVAPVPAPAEESDEVETEKAAPEAEAPVAAVEEAAVASEADRFEDEETGEEE